MTVQFVEIAGQKVALLPVDEYDRLVEAAVERTDIAAAMRAEDRRREGEEYVPSEIVDRLLDGENPLKTWRKFRNMTQSQLAETVGCKTAYISKLERGDSEATGSRLRALADALRVTVDDILPIN